MEDYKEKYEMALEGIQEILSSGEDSIKMSRLQLRLQGIFPELKESKDEKIRKALIKYCKLQQKANNIGFCGISLIDAIDWLEKQGESYTKKDIDDAYLKGISDAKNELEKQGTPAKLSEEEQNSFAKGVLSNCALSFINYLDAHSYEGKMCVSNGECEDIDYAFHNAMWDRLHRYYCKYIEKQGEQKPILDFKASNFYVSKVDGKIHDITYNSTDKVEPKFKIGDVLCDKSCTTLNKNSQPNIEILDIRDGMYICNNCTFPIEQQDEYELVAKEIEQKPVWSDEDDYNLQCMIAKVTCDIQQGYIGRNNELIDWLKSLKNRVQPQIKKWSDEDERMYKMCVDAVEYYHTPEDESTIRNWLKSLKERNAWKPSKKQMDALLGIMIESGFDYIDYNTLESLYNDLKKL